jgi:hypothetical protein
MEVRRGVRWGRTGVRRLGGMRSLEVDVVREGELGAVDEGVDVEY